ncbi:protein terminal ear1 homolog [Zingiber officinale]|uniref:protein terminal ear1 homolog n=1 Tax=Zingiber officinale TaxID=94328 RepID=UPI001C4BCAF7|nr:protein terminal ear1 homolog [Zingiber officinale]
MANLNPHAAVYVPVRNYTPIYGYSPPLAPPNRLLVVLCNGVPYNFELCLQSYHPPLPLLPPPPPVFNAYYKPSPPSVVHLPKATLTLIDQAEEAMKPLEQFCITDQGNVGEEVGEENIEAACKGMPTRSALIWRRKSRHRMRKVDRRVKAMNYELEFKKGEEGDAVGKIDQGKTTVMIRHLPNKLKKANLLSLLDKHCVEENQKIAKDAEEDNGKLSEFDFLYLPMDFKTGSNLGYAFVNFTSAIGACRLYDFLHNFDWKSVGSCKKCAVVYARIQGLRALQKHFQSSTFVCQSDEFLPVFFAPPRDGVNETEQRCVGKRLPLTPR